MSLVVVRPSVIAVNPSVVASVLNVEAFDHVSVKNRGARVCCVTSRGGSLLSYPPCLSRVVRILSDLSFSVSERSSLP